MRVEWVPLAVVLTPIEGEPVDLDRNYPIAGVYGFGRGVLLRDAIAGDQTGYQALTRLSTGDVVYSKLKAFEGAIACVHREADGRYVSPEFPVFRVDPSVAWRYLEHFLQSRTFLDRLAALSTGLGARRERVHPHKFLTLTVPLPPLSEQDRIAAHLSHLASLGRHRPGLGLAGFREWIFRSLNEHDAEVRKLHELVRPRLPEVVLPDAAYPMGGVFGFARGIIHRPTLRGSETKYKTLTLALEHDVVYSKLKAFEGAVAVAGAQDGGRYFSPEFPVFEQIAADVRPGYLEQVLLSPPILRALAERSTGVGARRERVHPARFLDLEVPIPTPAEQESVTDLCRRVAESEALTSRSDRLAAAILPAARNEIFDSMR